MTMPVRLTLPANATASHETRIEVNGCDIARACRWVQVRSAAGAVTAVEVGLARVDTVIDGEARVQVDDDTHEALIALGWTPPGESSS